MAEIMEIGLQERKRQDGFTLGRNGFAHLTRFALLFGGLHFLFFAVNATG